MRQFFYTGNPWKITCALAVAFAIFVAGPVHATLVNTLTVEGSAKAGTNTPQTYGPTSDANFVSESASDSASPNSQADANSWGNSNGVYRASAFSQEYAHSNAVFERELKITNNSGSAQQYSLDAYIFGGFMAVSNPANSDTGSARYDLSISKEGASGDLFASDASLDQDGTVVPGGTTLNDATTTNFGSSSVYSWSGTQVTGINLGILAPLEMMTILFNIEVWADAAFGVEEEANCSTNGGGEAESSALGEFSNNCFAQVALGDPNDLSGTLGTPLPAGAMFNVNGTNVPEPGSLALAGLALAVFRFRTRLQDASDETAKPDT